MTVQLAELSWEGSDLSTHLVLPDGLNHVLQHLAGLRANHLRVQLLKHILQSADKAVWVWAGVQLRHGQDGMGQCLAILPGQRLQSGVSGRVRSEVSGGVSGGVSGTNSWLSAGCCQSVSSIEWEHRHTTETSRGRPSPAAGESHGKATDDSQFAAEQSICFTLPFSSLHPGSTIHNCSSKCSELMTFGMHKGQNHSHINNLTSALVSPGPP
jgi:hypothetical protein